MDPVSQNAKKVPELARQGAQKILGAVKRAWDGWSFAPKGAAPAPLSADPAAAPVDRRKELEAAMAEMRARLEAVTDPAERARLHAASIPLEREHRALWLAANGAPVAPVRQEPPAAPLQADVPVLAAKVVAKKVRPVKKSAPRVSTPKVAPAKKPAPKAAALRKVKAPIRVAAKKPAPKRAAAPARRTKTVAKPAAKKVRSAKKPVLKKTNVRVKTLPKRKAPVIAKRPFKPARPMKSVAKRDPSFRKAVKTPAKPVKKTKAAPVRYAASKKSTVRSKPSPKIKQR